MYHVKLSAAESPLTYHADHVRITEFNLRGMKSIINRLLTRKERNNGIGRMLASVLQHTGSIRHQLLQDACGEAIGLVCRRTSGDPYRYSISLYGPYSLVLLDRLNRSRNASRSVETTRLLREERRRLRALGRYHDPKRNHERVRAGAAAQLRRHFRNSVIVWDQAVSAIAYAARLRKDLVQRRLFESLESGKTATLRTKGGFVFRVDVLQGRFGLVDIHAPVELQTTNDNRNGIYRRLRSSLKKQLNLVSKKRLRDQEAYEAHRAFKAQSRLFA